MKSRFGILPAVILCLFLAMLGTVTLAQAQSSTAPTSPEGVASVAEKAGGEEQPNLIDKEKDVVTAALTIAVFVALLIILRFAAWKPILTALKSRENTIRESIEAAGKAKAEAERTTLELESRIAEAQKQAAAQITQAKTDAVKVADSIKKQAEVESTQLKDRAVRDIEAAKQQALAEINAHAAELGTAIARKILQRQVTVDDQSKLVDETLAQLGKNRNN